MTSFEQAFIWVVSHRIQSKYTLTYQDTVNCRLKALGLYKFVRGLRWAYKRRGLYQSGGAYKRHKKI